ncbi:MAG: hypothetical protein RBS77_05310 [Candidatus Moranbacteria bacterium]|jgi:hypothetical protein|nr:hypothetical protein [Candidatus Moranbacteria bacterium]
MPYDPRPVSEDGNRGIDEYFSRQAPAGKFRVIGVDTFDGEDWVQGDCNTFTEACELAKEKGGKMTMMHVYNDQGEHMGNAGTF